MSSDCMAQRAAEEKRLKGIYPGETFRWSTDGTCYFDRSGEAGNTEVPQAKKIPVTGVAAARSVKEPGARHWD